MARGVNKVILIGNLGADPETRYTAGGSAVTNIRLATTRSWRDKQSGEQQERTDWHRVVFFGRLAEIAGEYLRKGSKAYVEGRLQTRKWQGQDGQDRYTTEVVANEMQMLDSRGGGTGDFNPQSGGGSQYEPAAQPARAPQGQPAAAAQPAPAAQSSGSGFDSGDDLDDDIPF